jgi:glycosyltransferase involved in cell wall biosynthesis
MRSSFETPPRVSVAMATYNGDRFIREQLESLRSQTLLPYEVVVTDDGSSDQTCQIIREFARVSPFPVRLHENAQRLGSADNFFAAAHQCRGDAIALCDQDDVWLPDKISTVSTELRRPGVVCVIHRGVVVDEELRPAGMLVPGIARDSLAPALVGDPWFEADGFCLTFSRDMLTFAETARRPKSRWPAPQMLHDEWVHFISHACGTTSYLREPLVLHRQHGANTSGRREARERRSAWSSLAHARTEGRQRAADWCGLRAGLAASRRDYLGRQIERLHRSSSVGERLARAESYYGAVERRWTRRADLYAVTRRRPIAFAALVATAAYRTQRRGGLGMRALVRDAFSVVGAL